MHDPQSVFLHNLKYIFVFGSLELGGSERQGLVLAEWLREHQGADVEVWGFSNPGRVVEHCRKAGISWRIVENPLVGGKWSIGKNVLRLAGELRSAGADVIIPYTTTPNVACCLAWKLSGASVCMWNQRDIGIERVGAFAEWLAVRLSPVFVANSCAGADFLSKELKVSPAKVNVIPNGVFLSPPEEPSISWRRRLDIPENVFTACMLANLSDKKDHATLLKAWQIVLSRCKGAEGEPMLVLAGRHDQQTKKIQDAIASLNIGRHVRLTGEVTDVGGLLASMDIGVFGFISEGMPNGVLECMASGLPVAATDIPGVRETLGAEHLLSPPGDAEKLADSIITLYNYPDVRKKAGNDNRQRARSFFDPEKMCRSMANVINVNLRRSDRRYLSC